MIQKRRPTNSGAHHQQIDEEIVWNRNGRTMAQNAQNGGTTMANDGRVVKLTRRDQMVSFTTCRDAPGMLQVVTKLGRRFSSIARCCEFYRLTPACQTDLCIE